MSKPSDPPDVTPSRPWFDGNNRPPYKPVDDPFTLDAIEEDDSEVVEIDWNLVSPEYLPQI